MSPAYGAVFLWLLATILWWSGWREEPTEGIPHWAVGIFLAVWPIALLGNVTITPTLSVNGAWLWTFIMIIFLGWRITSTRRWLSISAGILIGSIFVVVSRLAYYPSGISQYLAPWGAAAIVGWLSALLLRHVAEQVLAVSVGLYLSEAISALVRVSPDVIPAVHALEWMEGWWIAVLCSRLWSVAVRIVVEAVRRWGGQRS